jgi:hypothetical protein
MDFRGFSSISKSRFSVALREAIQVVLLVSILAIFIAIEPINKALVRDVIKQNATNQQLSRFAHDIVIYSLLCRRFEKDILLNINNPAVRATYESQWKQAISDLDQAIEGFQVTATGQSDREQAEAWQAESMAYQQAVLQLLATIDAGTILNPAEANQMLASGKSSIRSVTDTATGVSQEKDAEVEASSASISGTLTMSSRIITLFILAASIALTMSRRYV